MSNNNMINPANYYNPFAKYNYVSKTRGVYIPRETQPLLNTSDTGVQKSASIYSDNYDAETDLMLSMKDENGKNDLNSALLGFINRFLGSSDN